MGQLWTAYWSLQIRKQNCSFIILYLAHLGPIAIQCQIEWVLGRRRTRLCLCCPGCQRSRMSGWLFCCVCEILAALSNSVQRAAPARGIALTPCKAVRERSCLCVFVCICEPASACLPTCPVIMTLGATQASSTLSFRHKSGSSVRKRHRRPVSSDTARVCCWCRLFCG